MTDFQKGGNDVFVDIGDKRLGVLCCRRFFGGLRGGETLHIGGMLPCILLAQTWAD